MILLTNLVISCGPPIQSSGTTVPSQSLSSAFPPSAPLICPGQNQKGGVAYVQAHGTHFFYKGKQIAFYGYTFYPSSVGGSDAWRNVQFPSYIDHIFQMGAQTGQNILRPTDYWDQNYQDNPQENATIWSNMDYLICTASARGLFVEFDVSAFAKLIMGKNRNPYDSSIWLSFLDAIGKRYGNQPSIAFYSILGEPTPPTSVDAMNQLVAFYRATTDELHKADGGHHLIIAGGFNHMEYETPQTPWWQEIYSLPNNNIVAFKTYSQADIELIPTIARYARQIDKPMIDEEFGMIQDSGDAVYSGTPFNGIQTSRSQFYQNVYMKGQTNGVSAFIFWNMGCEIKSGSYSVSPDTPAVWHVIQQFAPTPPVPSDPNQKLC